MRNSEILGYFLDSVNIAAVAIMLSVLIIMAKETLDRMAKYLNRFSCIGSVIFKTKTNTIWTIIIGSLLGFILVLVILK